MNKHTILFSVILFLLASCGGPSGGGTAVVTPPPPVVTPPPPVVTPPPPVVTPPPPPVQLTLVSINFDDGFVSGHINGLPLFDAAGMKTTQFIITGRLTNTPGYITANDVITMDQAGHEIAAHTRTHPHLSTLTPAQQQDEIQGSKDDLTTLLGHAPTNFAYPYGDYDQETITLVQQDLFLASRGTDSNEQNNYKTNPYTLRSLTLRNTNILTDITTQIDQAIANKTWFIIVIHRVDEDGQEYSVRHELLQQVIDYLQQKNVEVITNAQAIQLLGIK